MSIADNNPQINSELFEQPDSYESFDANSPKENVLTKTKTKTKSFVSIFCVSENKSLRYDLDELLEHRHPTMYMWNPDEIITKTRTHTYEPVYPILLDRSIFYIDSIGYDNLRQFNTLVLEFRKRLSSGKGVREIYSFVPIHKDEHPINLTKNFQPNNEDYNYQEFLGFDH